MPNFQFANHKSQIDKELFMLEALNVTIGISIVSSLTFGFQQFFLGRHEMIIIRSFFPGFFALMTYLLKLGVLYKVPIISTNTYFLHQFFLMAAIIESSIKQNPEKYCFSPV